MSRRIGFLLVAAIFAGGSGAADGCEPGDSVAGQRDASIETRADFVFAKGEVYTVNESSRWAEGVAVSNSEIIIVRHSAAPLVLSAPAPKPWA